MKTIAESYYYSGDEQIPATDIPIGCLVAIDGSSAHNFYFAKNTLNITYCGRESDGAGGKSIFITREQ